jgi:hypothetical protein
METVHDERSSLREAKLAPLSAQQEVYAVRFVNVDEGRLLNNDTTRMLKAARKYNTNLAAIRLTPHLQSLLPASPPTPTQSSSFTKPRRLPT